MLSTAPKWQRKGIEAYEAFTNVFFLDKIERVNGDDALPPVQSHRSRHARLRRSWLVINLATWHASLVIRRDTCRRTSSRLWRRQYTR